METRTLLTVIALLLAGIVTIMLVRAESEGEVVSIFSNNYDFGANHDANYDASNASIIEKPGT